MSKSFELTDIQVGRIEDWEQHHDLFQDCSFFNREESLALADKYSYRFTVTSIGTSQSYYCACGSYINVTEYNLW